MKLTKRMGGHTATNMKVQICIHDIQHLRAIAYGLWMHSGKIKSKTQYTEFMRDQLFANGYTFLEYTIWEDGEEYVNEYRQRALLKFN